MFSRFRISITLALLLSLVLAIPAFAGGWAVITLHHLPTDIVVGQNLKISFSVLQHGKTPMTGLEPTITAELSNDEKFVVVAKPEGKPGYYVALITFPKEGNWEWSIQAFTMDQPMPMLSVAAAVASSASQPVAKAEPVTPSISPLWIVRILALGIGLFGLAVALRRNNRKALALTGLCLVVGLGSFVTGSNVPEVEAQGKPSDVVSSASSISQVELGQQLFIAKGCITCHVNRKIPNSSEYWTIEMGATDLSKFSASPEALRLRLKDPTLVKSDTKMPNLGLSAAEIEALIAFINSK